MERKIAIGIQDFSKLREKGYFYIDKTDLIREWWEAEDSTTLITRPRRFGKTLNISMLEQLLHPKKLLFFQKLLIRSNTEKKIRYWSTR